MIMMIDRMMIAWQSVSSPSTHGVERSSRLLYPTINIMGGHTIDNHEPRFGEYTVVTILGA